MTSPVRLSPEGKVRFGKLNLLTGPNPEDLIIQGLSFGPRIRPISLGFQGLAVFRKNAFQDKIVKIAVGKAHSGKAHSEKTRSTLFHYILYFDITGRVKEV